VALFSVWDWDKNAWAVYRNGDNVSVGDDPKPPKPTGTHAIGADPDAHVKPLPADAKFSGFSHVARGEVRRQASLPLGLDEPGESPALKYAAGAAAGSLLTWFLLRGK
jgi:hypothetical protein